MRRGRLPAGSCRHRQVNSPERLSGRNASPSGITPSNIMSPTPEQTRGSWTQVRLGARAHTIRSPANLAHGPPARAAVQPRQPRTTRLTCGPCTSKEPQMNAIPYQSPEQEWGSYEDEPNGALPGRPRRRVLTWWSAGLFAVILGA